MQEFLGLFLPARTPTDIGQRLNTLVREGLQSPEMVESLGRSGLQPVHQSPEEFAQLLKADYQRWASIAKATGFTAED